MLFCLKLKVMRNFKLIIVVILSIFLVECAKRGVPEGGPKDEDPPKLINAEPNENAINFKEKRIRLYFDEYIKLKEFRKQIVVSPPIDKSFYSINPQSGASKYIQIDIKKPLDENKTYVFNFGESIVDNNEGNKLPFFKYVFSTGEYVDSLSVKGNIMRSYDRKYESFISTFLYPLDENFNDSIVFNGLPNYVGNTLDSTNFEMTNLRKGKYMFLALKDENNNYKFDPEFDKIGFIDFNLNLPTTDSLQIDLFKENIPFESFRPFFEKENKIGFPFKGSSEGVEIKLIDSIQRDFMITKNKETDTLNYWFKKFDYDTLYFKISKSNYSKTYKLKKQELEKDSLIVSSSINSVLELEDQFKINSNIPLFSVDNEKISVLNKDSILVEFKTELDKNKFDINFKFEVLPNDNYTINILPNAIKDFYNNSNDTISYSFKTKSRSDYGILNLKINDLKEYPVIVQLLDNKESVVREKKLNSIEDPCFFENLKPANYFIRLIYDKNNNGMWDTGNFLNRIQPEKTFHYSEEIVVRANWVLEEKISVNQ